LARALKQKKRKVERRELRGIREKMKTEFLVTKEGERDKKNLKPQRLGDQENK